jgi:hypothetical protein
MVFLLHVISWPQVVFLDLGSDRGSTILGGEGGGEGVGCDFCTQASMLV